MKLPWSKKRERKESTKASSFEPDIQGVSNPIFIALGASNSFRCFRVIQYKIHHCEKKIEGTFVS